jgi:guanylate kinase
LLQKKIKGKLIVISSPSGAGKTTITKSLVSKKKNIELSVSLTTRSPRPNEIANKDYTFVNIKTFKKLVAKKSFLEHAKVFGNYYGTLKKKINNKIRQNKTIILDIDWQGARLIKKQLPKITTTIFILPPSLKELKKRLTKRESNAKFINLRMSKAKKEIIHWKEYDYVVVNDNLKKCISEIKSILNLIDRKPQYLKF